MAVTMKSANVWDVMLFSLVEAYQHFRGLASSTLKMEVLGSFELLINLHQTTQCHIPEYSNADSKILFYAIQDISQKNCHTLRGNVK